MSHRFTGLLQLHHHHMPASDVNFSDEMTCCSAPPQMFITRDLPENLCTYVVEYNAFTMVHT